MLTERRSDRSFIQIEMPDGSMYNKRYRFRNIAIKEGKEICQGKPFRLVYFEEERTEEIR